LIFPFLARHRGSITIAVQTERFEIPRRQFKQLFIFAGVLAGVGVVLDLLALVVFGKVLLMPLMWGIGLTLAGAFALYAALAYTRA
jgi:NhaP-type Na+/H+ or K+/H+ antiporter